jgi:hypothetical protein
VTVAATVVTVLPFTMVVVLVVVAAAQVVPLSVETW